LTKILEQPDMVRAELLEHQDGSFSHLEARIKGVGERGPACEDQEKRLLRLYRYGEIDDDFIRKEFGAIQERSPNGR
jgi:hypothetical protein